VVYVGNTSATSRSSAGIFITSAAAAHDIAVVAPGYDVVFHVRRARCNLTSGQPVAAYGHSP
jgi:hypothetical protein